jgi:tetratricopeptide (TPR) repeat protein
MIGTMALSVNESSAPEAVLGAFAQSLKQIKPDNPLPDQIAQAGYSAAYALLQRQDYANAEACFSVLVDYCPGEAKHWAGLGHSLLGLQRAEGAISALAIAASLDRNNAGISLALGQAFVAAGYRGFASQVFELAALQAADSDPAMVQRAMASLELLAMKKS